MANHNISDTSFAWEHGCNLPADVWADFNRTKVFESPHLSQYVSPFPPSELMQVTTGLTSEKDFASHGADFWLAFSSASKKPLSKYSSILDFGCGCGRFARMLKGYQGILAGCDVDSSLVNWCSASLPFMATKLSKVYPPLSYNDDEFEAIISISIFTHLNEDIQTTFLRELFRICQPKGRLFLTVHGLRAMERALSEINILRMLDIDDQLFQKACLNFNNNKHAFVLQDNGHLTTISPYSKYILTGKAIADPYEYGITFIPQSYLSAHWGQWFDIIDYRHGAIHNFQDIVVLTPKK